MHSINDKKRKKKKKKNRLDVVYVDSIRQKQTHLDSFFRKKRHRKERKNQQTLHRLDRPSHKYPTSLRNLSDLTYYGKDLYTHKTLRQNHLQQCSYRQLYPFTPAYFYEPHNNSFYYRDCKHHCYRHLYNTITPEYTYLYNTRDKAINYDVDSYIYSLSIDKGRVLCSSGCIVNIQDYITKRNIRGDIGMSKTISKCAWMKNDVLVGYYSHYKLDMYDVERNLLKLSVGCRKGVNDFVVVDDNVVVVGCEDGYCRVVDVRERVSERVVKSSSKRKMNFLSSETSLGFKKRKVGQKSKRRYLTNSMGNPKKKMRVSNVNRVRKIKRVNDTSIGEIFSLNYKDNLIFCGTGTGMISIFDDRKTPTKEKINPINVKKLVADLRKRTDINTDNFSSHGEIIDVEGFYSQNYRVDSFVFNPNNCRLCAFQLSNGLAGLIDLNSRKCKKLYKYVGSQRSSKNIFNSNIIGRYLKQRRGCFLDVKNFSFYCYPSSSSSVKILDWSREDGDEILLEDCFDGFNNIKRSSTFNGDERRSMVVKSFDNLEGFPTICIRTPDNEKVICGVSGLKYFEI